MNAKGTMKELVGAICPELDLDGCYAEIMPRVNTEQLAQLLGVAEQGGKTEMWSLLAVQFLLYGQQALVATHRDRLVAAVTLSDDAAYILTEAPNLSDANRNALVKRITDSEDAAGVLVDTPNLTDENRDMLVKRVTDSYDAAGVLRKAPNLTNDHRDILREVICEPLRQS